MLNGHVCRFYPENWHTPVDGRVMSMTLEDGSRFNFIVDIQYDGGEILQTVKLFVRIDPETRGMGRCRIL
jgi:hypothetical protein